MANKPRVFVGEIKSFGEIDTSTHPRNRSRMITLELRWGPLGMFGALFRAEGRQGQQVTNYLTGDKIRVTAVKVEGEKLSGMDIYNITEVEMA